MMPIATIDFEATALAFDADVIKVGIAIYDVATIRTCSSQVWPIPHCHWDEGAATVHNISPVELEGAPAQRWVAAELNRFMEDAAIGVAHCDGLEFDSYWMANLFHEAHITPVFDIRSKAEMPLQTAGQLSRLLVYLKRTPTPHRTGLDSELTRFNCYA